MAASFLCSAFMDYQTALTTAVISFLYWPHSLKLMHCFISYSCFMPEISSPGLRSAPPSTIDSLNCTN